VFLKIKRGSGVVLRLFFPKRHARSCGAAVFAEPPATAAIDVAPSPVRRLSSGAAADAPVSWVSEICKRSGDVIAALLLLILTAPLLLLAMLLIKLTSRGPVLYTQTRVGRHGLPFTIYKLRSMIHKCESLTGARWAVPGDPRVTLVGGFLRRTHLDELPQLWNVLRGDMSLVGPRPERPEFVPQLEQAIPCYRERLRVRPGVTGLAQVQLPADTDLDSVRVKLAYDLYYVRNCGLWLDARIMLSTALKMIGLPFRALRQLFRFPRREAIETACTADPRVLAPRVQTA
jgi:lipopolysaccharide/colanic/teichoic acid biosynthesis glycosyltransferase